MFLLVGGDSEIGSATYRMMTAQGKAVAATTRRAERISLDRPYLDLSAAVGRWDPPDGTSSACLCAAIARLADCAADPHGSAQINVLQTVALIEKLLARGIHVLFLSTNQVFDGRAPQVSADSAPAPVSEYGRQKARTEAVLLGHIARGAPAAILRLAKVVSARMPLIEAWTTELSLGMPIRAFTDMTLAPTPMDLVCAAISALMQDRATGVFQLTGPRDVTYAEVGRFLAVRVGAAPSLVIESSIHESGLPDGTAPPYTTLDSSVLRERYGIEAPDAWEVIGSLDALSRNRIGAPSA